ncbi:MAG: hypothetical protein U9P00_09810, partial [Pseudomonadota bacterium]|nr:hypothetical protein [Pseudomonadota bacterium]
DREPVERLAWAMPGATYSPQMIEKSDSTSLALATIAILGQAPGHSLLGGSSRCASQNRFF